MMVRAVCLPVEAYELFHRFALCWGAPLGLPHSLSPFLWPLTPAASPSIAETVWSCLRTMHLVLICP